MIARTAAGSRDESGQILILTALLLTVLLFSVGIAFNLGTLFVERRTMQEAVDAAAFGGSVVLFNGGTNAAAVTAATTDLGLNGYSSSNLTLTIESPPSSGAYAGNAQYVVVNATKRVETPLLPSEGGTTAVGVSATAGAFGKASNFAFMALSPTAANAFQVNNSADVTVTGGSVQVNSNAAIAATKSGTGQFNLSGGTAKSVGGQSGFTGWSTGQPSQPDPLSGFLRPSTLGATTYGPTSVTATTTLQPGIYAGGINISGGGTVTFAPGTFILAGGGLSVTGTPQLVGTGVTFFNTLTNYPTETGACGPVSLGGSSQMQINAPTTGYYTGMLIFVDSTCTQNVSLTGSSTLETANGTIYAANSLINIASTTQMQIGGQIIGNTITVGNTAQLTVTYNAATAARPTLPSLVQ